jgi:hypothetical protein
VNLIGQQWDFRGNEYASSSCIGKQEIEGFKKMFPLQSAKNSEGSDKDTRDSEERAGQKRSRTVKSEALNL